MVERTATACRRAWEMIAPLRRWREGGPTRGGAIGLSACTPARMTVRAEHDGLGYNIVAIRTSL